jgi:hypothetical protein
MTGRTSGRNRWKSALSVMPQVSVAWGSTADRRTSRAEKYVPTWAPQICASLRNAARRFWAETTSESSVRLTAASRLLKNVRSLACVRTIPWNAATASCSGSTTSSDAPRATAAAVNLRTDTMLGKCRPDTSGSSPRSTSNICQQSL